MSSISRFDHDTIVEPMKARIAELERQAAMKHPFTTAEFRRLEGRISELEQQLAALRKENQELRLQLVTALVPDGYKEQADE